MAVDRAIQRDKTDAPEEIIRRITDVLGLPQFNPASQRQLINQLTNRAAMRRAPFASNGNARRWFLPPTGNKSRNELINDLQGAHLIRGRQIMHGPGTDGAFG